MSTLLDTARKTEQVGWKIFRAVLGLGLGVAVFFLMPLIITALAVASAAVLSLVTFGSIVLIGALALNFGNTVTLMKAASRHVTNFVVPIFPVSILEVRLKEDRARRTKILEKHTEVVKITVRRRLEVEALELRHKQFEARIRVLPQKINPVTAQSMSRQLAELTDTLASRRRQFQEMEQLRRALDLARDIMDLCITEKEARIIKLKGDWEAANATINAVKGVRDVLGQRGEGDDLEGMALAEIDERYAEGLATVEMMMHELRDDVTKGEIDRAVDMHRLQEAYASLTAQPSEVSSGTLPSASASSGVRIADASVGTSDQSFDLLPVGRKKGSTGSRQGGES